MSLPTENNSKKRAHKGLIASAVGLAVNLILGGVKMIVGVYTGSVAVIADGINNLGDGGAAAVSVGGFSLLKREPTEKYPNGYGRVEYVCGMLVAAILIGFACMFLVSAVERVAYFYVPIYFTWQIFAFLALTLFVKIGLAVMYRVTNKEAQSDVIRLNMLDSILDAASTALALLSYALSNVTSFPVDGISGILIGVIIILNAAKSLQRDYFRLAGKGKEIRLLEEKIRRILENMNLQIAEIKGEDYGANYRTATVRLLFPAGTSAEEAYQKTQEAKRALLDALAISFYLAYDLLE